MNLNDNSQDADICRVCRSEGSQEKPLFYPCTCTGSIKYIHQDCLVQWLKFSKKEFCELCSHQFTFQPIYSSDMPNRLPVKDLIYGLLSNLVTAIKYWLHYSIVAIGWLLIVPLLSYRVIKCLFIGSFYSFFTLPVDILAFDKLIAEELYGAISVLITVFTIIGIIWLRELIIRERPDWLGNDNNEQQANVPAVVNNQPINAQIAEDDQPANVNNNVDNSLNPVEAVDVVDQQENNELLAVQDANWNQNEWGQNEEISFERIFGLDGSMLFLEHIFWVISLNAFFVFVFAFCPYHIGRTIGLFCLSKLDLVLELDDEGNKLEKVFVTFIGYLIIGILLVLLHYVLFKFFKARRLLGIGYLIIKVGVVTVLEIGIFPILCGWLLDIFSLPLFGSTISDRESYFRSSPGLSTIIHWCIGFAYIFYITSFLIILKDTLKPSLVSFFESLNNPDFSPVQEIIHLSVFQIVRRYIMYLIVFVLLTFLMVFLPVKATEKLFSNFLPYNIFTNYENKTQESGDLSIEIWRLHIMTPVLYDYTSLKNCIESLVNYLCVFFAYLLDLKTFLLKPPEENENNEDESDVANNSDSQDEEENLITAEPSEEQKPTYLYLRLFGLINLVCLTIFLFGFLMITLPTTIGRRTIGLFVNEQVSELYTVSCGLYIIILSIKIINLMVKWLPKGWLEISSKLKDHMTMFAKTSAAAVLLCGFLPLLIGFWFEVMIFVPIRVASNQTPVYYLVQDWLLGILLIKLIVLLALFNEWNLRETLEEFYQAGFVNIDLKKIINKFISPVFFTVGLILSIPYVFVHGLLPYLGFSYESLNVILRKIYLSIWCGFTVVYLLQWQFYKFCKLYEHIKNEKYLIGRKLINFEKS